MISIVFPSLKYSGGKLGVIIVLRQADRMVEKYSCMGEYLFGYLAVLSDFHTFLLVNPNKQYTPNYKE